MVGPLRLIGADGDDIATWPESESGTPRGELGMTISEKRWHAMHRDGRPSRHLHSKDSAHPTGGHGMQALRFTEQFRDLFTLAVQMTSSAGAEAIMLLLDGPADWSRLRTMAGKAKLIVAADTSDQLEGAKEDGIPTVQLDMPDSPMYERQPTIFWRPVPRWSRSTAVSTPTASTR
jgi:hypothetical protein